MKNLFFPLKGSRDDVSLLSNFNTYRVYHSSTNK
jgi:hypothetical protein